MALRKRLIRAIEEGDFVRVIRYMRRCKKKKLNIKDKNGDTLLHTAVQELYYNRDEPNKILL